MVPQEGAWTTMTEVNNDIVRHKRRLVSNMVSNDALRAFEPHGILYLETFCRNIGEEKDTSGWSSPKSMTDECKIPDSQLAVPRLKDF